MRVELAPGQVAWLVDELEEMRGPLEEEWQRLLAQPEDANDVEATSEREAVRYQLRLLRLVRANVPAASGSSSFVFVGPTAMVLDVVRAAMRNAVDALGGLAHRGCCSADDLARLRDLADAAHAWVGTFVDCRAVDAYRFDPESDPPPVV